MVILSSDATTEPSDISFDGELAVTTVADLCQRGQRFYGAPKRQEAIDHLRTLLDQWTDQTALQRFEARESKSGKSYPLVNIIGRQNPEVKRRILLGSHWDTRLWAEEDEDEQRRDEPIVGANDGTSGLAVLLEVARVLKSRDFTDYGIDFVFFDGEEFGRPGSNDYCQGSRYFARMLKSLYPRSRPEKAIIIDMVGDCDQQFQPEASSIKGAPRLALGLWETAESLGFGRFFAKTEARHIEDDHTALQKLGIPSVLLIDYDYPHWHTQGDTVDKVCASSLDRVGEVLIRYLTTPEEGTSDG